MQRRTGRLTAPHWVGRVLLLLSAVALAVPLAAVASQRAPYRLQATAPVEALLVGDSVMAGMAQSYGKAARDLLAARHSFLLDAKGCRRLITTSCSIGSSPPPSTAITVVTANAGRYSEVLVVAAGYNDSTTGTSGLGNAVDRLVAEAVRQGVPHVIWLTYREAGPSAARFRAHNNLLRQKLAVHPQLRLADWASRSAYLPTSWFSADGIHLGTEATKAMADLIA
ncbi:MAG TPA: hypothetical protein DCR14_17770, partial [Acidimicrobiaceae bacterium]|nr:hypothetical protein [Acidimicrobiaceae bacterium]